MGPRPNVSEQRRGQIMEAAQAIFARLGFHKARMEDIAREAGVSKGTLYWYYRSKDALIAAILDRIFSREIRSLRTALGADEPVAERLFKLARASVRHMLDLHIMAPLMFEFYALAARNGQVRESLKRYYAAYQADLAHLITEGVQRGEFRPDLNAETVARNIIAMFEGSILLWVINPESINLEEQVMHGMEMCIRSISVRGGDDAYTSPA